MSALVDGSIENKSHHAVYRKTSLRRHQIRLLTISPKDPGDNDDVVCCKLETVDLHDPSSPDYEKSKSGSESRIPYTTLSYTWGDETKKVNIKVDDEVFQATENLRDALKQFRTQDPIPKLWVDAICINQDHHGEKMEQVQLMQTIFRQAKETWVWLGLEKDKSSDAIDLVKVLAGVYFKSCKEGGTDPEFADPTRWATLRFRGLENQLLALDHLLARDYWYRVWIVQEIAVSKNLTLFCGPHKFPWHWLLYTAYLLNFQVEAREIIRQKRSGKESARGLHGGIQRILSVQSVRNDIQNSSKERLPDSLLFLLSNHRSTGATNKRDKYIALAGLSRLDHSKDNLYEKGEGDVYITACESLKKELRHRPLDFLDCAGLPRNFSMPSWVPDWSVPNSTKPDWLVTQGRAVPLLYWDLATKKDEGFVAFNAPGGKNLFQKTPPPIHGENTQEEKPEDPARDALVTRGLTIDSIIETNTIQKPLVERIEDQAPVDCTSSNRPKYPNGEDLTDVLWKCLVLNRAHAGGREAPGNWGDIFYQYVAKPLSPSSPFSSHQDWYNRSKHFRVRGSTLEGLAQEWKNTKPERVCDNDELAQFKTALSNALGYRKLASTEKSGYLCLVPLDAKAGDIVAVLADCSVPVLLRRHGAQGMSYEFVGTCYVHGIMHGEAVKGLDVKTRFPEEFDIR